MATGVKYTGTKGNKPKSKKHVGLKKSTGKYKAKKTNETKNTKTKSKEPKMHKTQFAVLQMVAKLGGKMVPGPEVEKLAAKQQISIGSARRAMYNLTQDKYLYWTPEEVDARTTIDHVTLTPQGKEFLKKGND